MTKLRWTTQAVEDVEAIRKFIANVADEVSVEGTRGCTIAAEPCAL